MRPPAMGDLRRRKDEPMQINAHKLRISERSARPLRQEFHGRLRNSENSTLLTKFPRQRPLSSSTDQRRIA